MAQVTQTVAQGIIGGQGYTDNEVRQLAHFWLAAHPAPTAQPAPAAIPPWKDHQTAKLVNELRDCAKEFHGTQQLRDRLLRILGPMIDWVRAAQPPAAGAAAHTLSDAQIEAMPVWRNFVGLWPESRREIVDAVADLLAAAPTPAAQQGDDTARLDWLDRQCEACGFQDIHEGNRWEVRGAYANLRKAIDAERAALAQKEGK